MIEKILTQAINQGITLMPELAPHLKPLRHKTVALHILGLDLILYFTFHEDNVEVSKKTDRTPATTLSGYPFSLLAMIKRKHVIGSGITINGEVELAEALKNLLSHLDIDWEEQLSRLTGDVMAHHLANAGRKIFSSLNDTKKSLSANVSEYLIEEKNIIVSKAELELFYDEVDTLNLSIERLHAKLKKSERRREIP